MLKMVGIIIMVVSDMRRSVDFYSKKLGIPVKFESPEWTELQSGTVTIGLHLETREHTYKPDKKSRQAISFGFHVDDINRVHHELKSRGVKFTVAPLEHEWGRYAEFTDPDGYRIMVSEHAGHRRAAKAVKHKKAHHRAKKHKR